MKRFSQVIVLLLLGGFFSCEESNLKSRSKCGENSGVPEPYLYPPASDFLSLPYTERLEKLQLPAKILKYQCTYDLVETYLTYPYINILGHNNNFKVAFRRLLENFNGARELTMREDGSTQLLKRYEINNMSNFDSLWDSQVQHDYKWKLMLLELTLSQEEILNNLNLQSRNALLISAVNVLFKRESSPSLFLFTNHNSNDFLIANTLFSIGYPPFKKYVSSKPKFLNYLNGYLEGTIGETEKDSIRLYAKSYLKNLPK